MMKIRVTQRLYNDYLMPGRWDDYRSLLQQALQHGYRFVRHDQYDQPDYNSSQKYFFLRHDIDSDIKIAKKMFRIEQELGVQSTYYFRLSTLDFDFMQQIHSFGSEVGYHYEEIADYIKKYHLKTPQDVQDSMPKIQDLFVANVKALEERLGFPIQTAASHGDFMNRAFQMPNLRLMNEDVRERAGIRLEAYDECLGRHISFRAADEMYPVFWNPSSPVDAIHQNSPVVFALVHPRQWQCAPLSRFRLDFDRVMDEFKYRREKK